jgi:hypothetical protein
MQQSDNSLCLATGRPFNRLGNKAFQITGLL